MPVYTKIFPAHRIFNTVVTVPDATPASRVWASLTEMGRSNAAGALDTPILGDATMKVYNVTPAQGVVRVRGEVDWDSNLDIRVSLFLD